MFKSARWRSEKNKIKAVFKLQFHATQVSQVVGDALMVSMIPADVGKPTLKLEKATVRDGCCYWENPVHETVKFVQEPKSGKIHERIYYFVVANGSSKAGVVGEASIDFSAYAEATKISSVALPLKNSKSAALLHVSIQRIQESTDQREAEESENVKDNFQDRSLRAQLSSSDMDEILQSTTVEDSALNKTLSHATELNGNCRASTESDLTLSSSGSSSGLDTPRERHMKSKSINQDASNFLPSLTHTSLHQISDADASGAIYEEPRSSQWDWLGGSAPEASTDGSTSTPRETLSRITCQEAPDVIEKLKSELIALARQVEISELELQTLRKQIVKESKKGQDLSREIAGLKNERDMFKEECERYKAYMRRLDEEKAKSKLRCEGGDLQALVEELRQELNHEKELNSNLRVQLQKTQESNSELILAVRDLDEMLEQKNKEISLLPDKPITTTDANNLLIVKTKHEADEDDDEEQKALEELVREHNDAQGLYLLEQKVMDLQSEIEIYRRDRDELEMQMEQLALDYEILKQENHDLSYKMEQSQLQEQLKIQYECKSPYAAINELETEIEKLKKDLNTRTREFSDSLTKIGELEAEIERLGGELKDKSYKCSASLITIGELESEIGRLGSELNVKSQELAASYMRITELDTETGRLEADLQTKSQKLSASMVTISELQAHVKSLEEELDSQAQGFEADLEALTREKIKQEQRAIQAEETLRKTRWHNATTADRLQEEFKKLSQQMASTFEANEKLATKALTEANELRIQKRSLEEMLHKAVDESNSIKDNYEARLQELSSQVTLMSAKMKQMQSEIEQKTALLKYQEKHADDHKSILTGEMAILKSEIEKLTEENKRLSDNKLECNVLTAELEHMRKLIEDMELLIQQGNKERSDLEDMVASSKSETEALLKELETHKSHRDEKESILLKLEVEVTNLQAECHDLRNSLVENELEKEKVKKQVCQLKGDLKKKEDAFNILDKKLKDMSRIPLKNNKSPTAPRGPKEIVSLKEKIKVLEGQIKQKEGALENSTNSFLEKEKDLHSKIEELENKMESLLQNSRNFEIEAQKVAVLMVETGIAEELECTRNLGSETGVSESISTQVSSADECSHDNSPPNIAHSALDASRDINEMLDEMTLLREKNKTMEGELKEMQERYSEISLKFAEVEGERQQLVMRVRNLKNARKSS